MAKAGGAALATPSLETAPSVALVIAPYYGEIAAMLEAGARAALGEARVTELRVPGALEIGPAIAQARKAFDGFVALGCVLRGETSHYDIVAGESARALTDLGLAGVCVGNGILTCETMAQAQERADPARMNKGAGAAEACLHLIALSRRFTRPGGGQEDVILATGGVLL